MTTQQPPDNHQLPAAGNVAIYKRSATQEKLVRKQIPIQQHDLIHLAHELGYDDTHIFLFEQDNGTPGNTDIDKRVGLAFIVQSITNGTIQAIVVADETRLFRGIDATELNYFISACREHHTVVYTPVATYDFSNPLHVKLFLFNCQQAFVMLQEAYKIMQRTRSNHDGS